MSELGANQNSQASSTNAPSLASALNLFSSLGDRMELLTAFVSTILANFRGNLTRSGKNRNQGSRAVEEMDELPIANALPPRYLLLCISMWKGYYFTQMLPVDLNVANDEMLFCQLKSAYHCQVGLWKRILSLRCIKDIRFVRVSTIFCNRNNQFHLVLPYLSPLPSSIPLAVDSWTSIFILAWRAESGKHYRPPTTGTIHTVQNQYLSSRQSATIL